MHPTPALSHALLITLAIPSFVDLSLLFRFLHPNPAADPADTPALSAELRRRFAVLRQNQTVERELRRCELLNLRLITWWDESYPPALRELAAPASVLYLRGSGPWPPDRPVTIVGARRSTGLGRSTASDLGEEVALRRGSVVSGLAIGIDQAALGGCAGVGGACYAILACGVDRIYPPGARRLAERIATLGRLVSEMPLGTPPLKHFFPRRNRLLAALSSCVLVVEADLRSGSLITAHQALDLGRGVYAVPGSIDRPSSRGTNRLVRDGAHPILERDDVDGFLPRATRRERADPLIAATRLPASAESIARATGLPLDAVLLRLVDLEVEGKIQRLPGSLYQSLEISTQSHSASKIPPAPNKSSDATT